MLSNKKPLQRAAQESQIESEPLLAATREKPTQQQRPSTAKNLKNKQTLKKKKQEQMAETQNKWQDRGLTPNHANNYFKC